MNTQKQATDDNVEHSENAVEVISYIKETISVMKTIYKQSLCKSHVSDKSASSSLILFLGRFLIENIIRRTAIHNSINNNNISNDTYSIIVNDNESFCIILFEHGSNPNGSSFGCAG